MSRFARPLSTLGLGLILLAAAQGDACAGAWTKLKGEGEVFVTGLYSEASEAFDANGVASDISVFRKVEIGVHAEYGVTDWLTAIGRTEFKTTASGAPISIDEARFGLTGVGARIRLWEDGGTVVSAEATGRLAVGGGAEAEEGDADLRLLAGHGFMLGNWPSFIDLGAAYRFRFGEPSDEFRADLAFGVRPRERWLFMMQSFNTFSDGGTPGDLADPREHKLQLSAVYDVTESLSLQVGGTATIAGRNALAEQGLVTALWYRF